LCFVKGVATPLSILVVDDQPKMIEVLSEALEKEGHTVAGCRSGVEALQRLHTAHDDFNLLICDHHMPGSLDGLGLVRIARSRGFRGQIVVTSGAFPDDLKKAYEGHSALGFLPKPFDMALLRSFVFSTTLTPRPAPELRVLPLPAE
jgi:CheY-like chemotaxis protein